MENQLYGIKQRNIISLIIFLISFVFVIISSITVIFPALLLRVFGGLKDYFEINPFEPGALAIPFLIANAIVLCLCVLHYKKILPKPITKSFKFILDFEISPQLALFVVIIIIGSYITLTIGELNNGRFEADFQIRVKSYLENFQIEKSLTDGKLGITVQLFLEKSSMSIFGNYKVIPFIGSIALLVVTYLLTAQIAKKRFAGIVAMCLVIQSSVFYFYDTGVEYPNFWILFYLASLYFVLKSGILSPIFFVLGALSKPLIVAFLPMSVFFVFKSDISKKKKLFIVSTYGVIVIIAILGLFVLKSSTEDYDLTKFSIHDFWGGITAINTNLQTDGLILIFLLPLTTGLYLVYRRGVRHADTFMFLILGILLSGPILITVSNVTNMPYRLITLVTFFAIGVGILLSKNIEEPIVEGNLEKQNYN